MTAPATNSMRCKLCRAVRLAKALNTASAAATTLLVCHSLLPPTAASQKCAGHDKANTTDARLFATDSLISNDLPHSIKGF